ncbi:unnamed protein product [Thelazia callipaeda]|uniref:EGF-like domain-containing protein n=1 Tax=Thelazia callipaeda TaxID=103827 RepID=A0A0N5CN83_THECL|nr:unnamed protein product [Thelazia callipaeda]
MSAVKLNAVQLDIVYVLLSWIGSKKYFVCSCSIPYYGRQCEYEYIIPDFMDLFAAKLNYRCEMSFSNLHYCKFKTLFVFISVSLEDECSYEDCNNRGTCLGTRDAVFCACNFGYSGSRCEIDLPCESLIHCSGHGICFGQQDRFFCLCHPGFFGIHCQHTMFSIKDTKGLVHTKVN